jgi:hypothetical protein
MWIVYLVAAWVVGGLGIWAMLYAHGEDREAGKQAG